MRRAIIAATTVIGALGAAGAADAKLVGFSSPSGNIGCMGETGGGNAVNEIRCDIRTHSYRPPAKPASCDFDWGGGLSVMRRGRASWNCVSDTVLGSKSKLAYGTSRRIGGITCKSSKAGMRCTNAAGHGFFLSRTRAYRF